MTYHINFHDAFEVFIKRFTNEFLAICISLPYICNWGKHICVLNITLSTKIKFDFRSIKNNRLQYICHLKTIYERK